MKIGLLKNGPCEKTQTLRILDIEMIIGILNFNPLMLQLRD
jgi:hypothetical protein